MQKFTDRFPPFKPGENFGYNLSVFWNRIRALLIFAVLWTSALLLVHVLLGLVE